MKIICNKNQFAEMVCACYEASSCYNCVLSEVCAGQNDLIGMVEIKEDEPAYQVFHGTADNLPKS